MFQIIAINGVSLVGLPLSTCQQYIKVMTLPDMKETLLCGLVYRSVESWNGKPLSLSDVDYITFLFTSYAE